MLLLITGTLKISCVIMAIFFDVLVSTVASQQEDFGTWRVAPAMDRACFHSVLCLHELSLHTPAYSSIRRHL